MRIHHVQKNESIESIAKKYGFSSWKLIYYAPCNNRLRIVRPDASKIKPGDEIVIPENAVEAAKRKIAHLKKLRADYLEMNSKIVNDWRSEYRKVNIVKDNVDLIGKIALIFVDLGNMAKEGFSAMKLTGQELAKANAALARSAIKMGYEPIVEVAAETSGILDVRPSDGLFTAFGKDALHFFLLDMKTPSYWASKVSGTNIEQINKQVLSEIETQTAGTLKNIDAQISKAELMLLKLKVHENCKVPNLY